METAGKTISSANLYKVAALSALGMIVFFLLMKLAGLVTIVEFRFLNFIIMFIGIRYMLLSERRAQEGKLDYLPGMLTGFMTALFTSLFFAVFVFTYLSIVIIFLEYFKVMQPF